MKNLLKDVAIVLAIMFAFSSCDKGELLDENRPTQVFHQNEALTDSTTTSSEPVPEVVVNIWGKLLIEGKSVADPNIRVTIKDVVVNNGNELVSPAINETLMEPTGTGTTWSNLEGLSFSKVKLCEPVHFPQVVNMSISVGYVVRELPLGRIVLEDHLRRELHYSSPFQSGSIDVECIIDLREIKCYASVDDFSSD